MSPDLQGIDPGLLLAPFAAGLLVLATHVPLGIEVLRRGIIFIDLAVAQVAALGAVAASLVDLDAVFHGIGPHGLGAELAAELAAGLAAILGALLLTWSERRWTEIQEALIGLVFVFAAAAGILLLAGDPHGGEHLRDLLAGQILWVGWRGLLPVAVLYAALLAAGWALRRRERVPGFAFYAIFALAVTASVQLVGVLLVFASLIAPAVASRHLAGRARVAVAFAGGAAAYALGLVLSLMADLPAGAAIVCCLCGLAVAGLRRRGGRGEEVY